MKICPVFAFYLLTVFRPMTKLSSYNMPSVLLQMSPLGVFIRLLGSLFQKSSLVLVYVQMYWHCLNNSMQRKWCKQVTERKIVRNGTEHLVLSFFKSYLLGQLQSVSKAQSSCTSHWLVDAQQSWSSSIFVSQAGYPCLEATFMNIWYNDSVFLFLNLLQR